MQPLRAIHVLDRIGSDEAVRVLERIAAGCEDDSVRADALASLARLRGLR